MAETDEKRVHLPDEYEQQLELVVRLIRIAKRERVPAIDMHGIKIAVGPAEWDPIEPELSAEDQEKIAAEKNPVIRAALQKDAKDRTRKAMEFSGDEIDDGLLTMSGSPPGSERGSFSPEIVFDPAPAPASKGSRNAR